jgi:2-polyprenyl-6-hydroxyphenyl methylase/3-demethylubiquinone-9 3-methyltransferase
MARKRVDKKKNSMGGCLWVGIVALVLSAALAWVATPPQDVVPRTSAIDPSTTDIDNGFYDTEAFANNWWTEGGWASPLLAMNDARVPYFDRAFHHLDTGVSSSDQLFLDIGCGGGLATEAMARHGHRMIGLDISPRSIETAKRHAKEAGVSNVEYVVGSALELPFPDHHFDGVVMSDVIEHIHDLPALVKEINRVLKPGGVFTFDTINRTWKSHVLNLVLMKITILGLIPPHTHDYRLFTTPAELTELLAPHMAVKDIVGLEPVVEMSRLLKRGSPLDVITTFRLAPNDTDLSYLGYAVKPKL